MPSDWRDVDSEPNRLAEFQKKILEIADETVCELFLKFF